MTTPRGSTPIARRYRFAPATVVRFACRSSADRRAAAVLAVLRATPFEVADAARVGAFVAPAPPDSPATIAATATKAASLLHPFICLLSKPRRSSRAPIPRSFDCPSLALEEVFFKGCFTI
jgi:hypothetical protein